MTKTTRTTRGISILGSTGSIGTSALDLIDRLNAMRAGRFRVAGLTAGRNADRLIEQVKRFEPSIACIASEDLARRVRHGIGSVSTRIVSGPDGLTEVATLPEADLVLAAIVGAAGLEPTCAAVERGKTVALANKEALVMAGDLMISAARRSGSLLLPVDSEHNALHQCLRGEKIEEVRRLVLTASGGPFHRKPEIDLSAVTPEEALAHPTWVMGRKISIDSATLMNKALEVIEARWLYDLPGSRISVIVHPQSTIHSMVEFVDGSFICQLGATDMRHPIQYALTWPERCESPLEPVNLAALKEMSFMEPDLERFPCLGFGWRALESGGTMPAVLNAANEVAVEAFLAGRIKFVDIPRIIDNVMAAHRPAAASSLKVILQADAWAREAAVEAAAPSTAAGALTRPGGNAPCPTR
ncbi:MAG TPA: 1-deoxy-D-xylulose-5-phosphate reductoisomerase [Patescibacteria group bacterium]|nr:1-deoxy-D-xylulose-5-phosphate reductoisomerase [Patescibacteria group bacterium]